MTSRYNVDKSGMQNTVSISKDENLLQPLEELYGDDWRAYRKIFNETCNPNKALSATRDLKAPLTLAVEFVNRCNLKCVMCWTENHTLELANLDSNNFEELLSQLPNLSALVMGLGSEIFVYKDWEKIFEIIKLKNIKDTFLSTNGTMLDDNKIDIILNSNISRVEISLDAATELTYKKIRGFDKLKIVEENIIKLIKARDTKGSRLPLIRLCFVVQELNKNEVVMFKEKWGNLVDYVSFQQLQDVSRVSSYMGKNLDFWLTEESAQQRKAETSKLNNDLAIADPEGQGAFCSYPFNSLNVWSNGDITPCCCFFGKALVIGNIGKMKLEDAWNSDSLSDLRDQFNNSELNKVCRDCLSRKGDHRSAVSDGTN